ncbi:MAG TPA: hypothetical protein VGK97_09585 [Spongiibacteraceae bacterium]
MKLEKWYDTEAALILIDVDPRLHANGMKPSKKIVREKFPTAAELLLIFERSDLLPRYPEKQSTWRFLAAAYRAECLTKPLLLQHFEAWMVGNHLAQGERFNERTGLAVHAQKILHKYPAIVEQFSATRGLHKLSYENDNLKKTIGLLLSAFLQQRQSHLLGTIEHPNVSQIVKALQAHSAAVNLDSEGLGKTSLTEKITAAIKYFRESKME